MENDQTIFQNKTQPNTQTAQPVSQPLPVSPTPIVVSPLINQPSPIQAPPANPSLSGNSPINDKKRNFLPSKKLLKILLGILALLIVAVIVFFVMSQSSKKEEGTVTLDYWGLWEDGKVMQSIISDFERENPNIKVSYSKQDIKQYRDTLVTRIDNSTGPDIYTFHNTWYPMLSSVLLPFPSDTMSKEEFSNSFYDVTKNDLVKNGAIYGIPLAIDTLGMYVNTDLFNAAGIKPPQNWNDFIDAARILTVKDESGKIKTAGVAMGTFDNVTHAPDIISLLFLQNSVDIKDIQGSADRIQGALNFYSSFAVDENNVWDNTLDPSILAFSKGNLAIYFGYSWDYFQIKAFNPNLKFEILNVPQLANQSINLASYWACGVSVKSAHQKQALLFIKFLARKETEEKLYTEESKERAFGEPYARPDLADSLKENLLVYPFVSQAKTAGSSYFVDSTNDNGLNQELNTYLGNAINAIVSGSSVETAFDTFSKGVTQVLQKYGQ